MINLDRIAKEIEEIKRLQKKHILQIALLKNKIHVLETKGEEA